MSITKIQLQAEDTGITHADTHTHMHACTRGHTHAHTQTPHRATTPGPHTCAHTGALPNLPNTTYKWPVAEFMAQGPVAVFIASYPDGARRFAEIALAVPGRRAPRRCCNLPREQWLVNWLLIK